jgi:hypothetical protein
VFSDPALAPPERLSGRALWQVAELFSTTHHRLNSISGLSNCLRSKVITLSMPKIIDPAPSQPLNPAAPGFDLAESAVAGRSLVDFRRVLFARKYLILIVVAVAIVLSIIYAQTRTPLYEATATAEVDLPRSESMGLSSAVASLYSDDATTTVQTQAFRLTGHSLIYRAISELAADHRGPFPESTIAER